MGFYYFDKDHPYVYPIIDEKGARGVLKVLTLDDYIDGKRHLQQIKEFWEEMGNQKEEQDEESLAITDAIIEQEKQLETYKSSLATFNSKYFSENLEFLLRKHKMKVSDLESLLEVSQGYISRTMGTDSKKRLSIDIAWMIAELFHIRIDDLVRERINTESKDLKMLLRFVDKLDAETDHEVYHWDKAGIRPNEKNGILFANGQNGDKIFAPNGEELAMEKVEEIYTAETRIGDLFFVRYKDLFFGDIGYAIYLFDEGRCRDMSMAGFDAEPLIVLAKTSEDSSHALLQKCQSLEKTIIRHEYDYTMDDLSRRYINSFLETEADCDEDLPFS